MFFKIFFGFLNILILFPLYFIAESAENRTYRIDTIIIDPGHGGPRSMGGIGTIGVTGTREKDVTLDIAKRVVKYLEKSPGVEVKLTRTTDKFVGLKERTNFANKSGGDIFISIHANYFKDPEINGIEMFVFKTGLKSKSLSRRIDKNGWNLNVDDKRFLINDKTVLGIVENLRTDRFRDESISLARAVHSQMVRDIEFKDRGIKRTNYYVLRWVRMPAILIETGFLSNKDEEKKLKTRSYRKQIAKSIADGIIAYKTQFEKLN